MADSPEMQRTRYCARKHGLTIFKLVDGYLLMDNCNNRISDKFGLTPQPLNAVKTFLLELEIENLKKEQHKCI